MLVILLGALLVIGGLVYMVGEALKRGRLSGTAGSSAAQSPGDVKDGTLEPARHGVGFLGIAGNWPGLAMMALGAFLLLFGAAFL
jgi:hypothetical protein